VAGDGRDAPILGRVHSVWDLSIELSEIRDLGDTVVALGRIQTRGNTSGVELESPVGYVFEFDGGLIRTYRAYLDPSEALRAAELRRPAADN
jgi:ketosteroid isomerase-like protein